MDDIEVAGDTLTGLKDSNSNLYIGAGCDLAEGTFWAGLIDDVRIFNRVLAP